MNRNILHVDTILEYLDQPQLFVARDDFDTMYLCLLYDDKKYTAIRISSSRLKKFENKEIDLLSLYTSPENANEYFDVNTSSDGSLTYTPIKEVPKERLPLSGYYLTKPAHEKVVLTIPCQDKSLFSSIIQRFGWVAMW